MCDCFNWERQMKSERKPIKVRSKLNVLNLRTCLVASHGCGRTFWIVDLNVIFGCAAMAYPSAIGIPRVAMIFPDPLCLLECFVCQVLVFPTSLSSPKVYWHCLILRWYTVKFYDKSNDLSVSQKSSKNKSTICEVLHHLGLRRIS